jgi:hypothetical protein
MYLHHIYWPLTVPGGTVSRRFTEGHSAGCSRHDEMALRSGRWRRGRGPRGHGSVAVQCGLWGRLLCCIYGLYTSRVEINFTMLLTFQLGSRQFLLFLTLALPRLFNAAEPLPPPLAVQGWGPGLARGETCQASVLPGTLGVLPDAGQQLEPARGWGCDFTHAALSHQGSWESGLRPLRPHSFGVTDWTGLVLLGQALF